MPQKFGDKVPKVSKDVYLAPGSQVIGDVILKKGASVWFNSVIRGDLDQIEIGELTNIQDGCVCHVDKGYPIKIGDYVTVGHRAILHGCKVGDNTLIGMGATIMNGVEIGDNCVIAAGALIPEGKTIPSKSLVIGVPGKIARELSEEELSNLSDSAKSYHEKAQEYLHNK